MANPARKLSTKKDHGFMDEPPDLLDATSKMDIVAVRACVDSDPRCVEQTDRYNNNAMHLCVGGGSQRVLDIISFFLEETSINLLHKNNAGDTPLDLAIGMNDQSAIDLLYPPTQKQLLDAFPDPKPSLEN